MLLVVAALLGFERGQIWAAIASIAIMLALAYVSHKIILHFRAKVANDWKKFTSVRVADGSAVTFVVAYLLPLVTIQVDAIRWGVLIVVLFLLATLVFYSDAYLVNPLLAMPPFAYHFYEVTTEEEVTFILVSRREIMNTRDPIDVLQVSRFMYLEVEG